MSKATVERLATAAPVPLRAVYETARRLDELSTARIIGDIAEALHKAQTGGKPVHRLTPDAIVIAPSGEPALSLPAGPEAPLAYASPERIKGMTGDRRSDVFSLGVVLWEALAHTRLFEGTDEAVKRAVLERDIRPPSEKNANVPAELDAICKKALARDPADRYQSAKVMAAEISAVLDDAGYPDDHSRIAKFLSELPASAKSTMPGIGPKTDAAKPAASDKNGSRAKSPTGAPAERAKSSTSQPVGNRAKSPTGAPAERAKTPTSQPLGDRAKSPTSPGSLAERLAAATPGRAKTPTAEPTTAAAAAPAPTTLTSPPAPADDPSKTAILGSGNPDVATVPAAPLVPAAPIVAKAPLPAPARARSASRPPPTEPTVAASPEILPAAAGSQPTPAPAAAPTPLVRVGSAPIAAAPSTTQNGAVATPVDAAGSGATKTADLPEAANAVSLPRAQTKGDVLQGWGWGTDSHATINPIEDDDDESTYAAERAKQRKRLFMAIGGVFGAIVLVVLIALAFGGGGDKAEDKEKAAKPSSGAVPPTDPQPEPAVTKTEPAKVEEPKPDEPKPAEPKPAEPEPAPEPKPDVAKTEPPKPEPPKPEPPKKEEPKKAEPAKKEVAKKDPAPKKEVAKKDPAPKKEVAKKDPKPVDPYAAATKVDAATAYRTGLQQFAKGDNKAALETFRTSLTTNQNHAPTWRGIGLVYEKLGKKAQAKIAFRKYLELSPKASDADQIRERMGRL